MSAASYILALDQGTTSSRSIVFNAQGEIVSVAQKEFRQHYPKPGWVEHDPMEIWASQSATLTGAISRANLRLDSIAGIGITNQRETTIVWEADSGKPVYPAIVWQDRRTAGLCDQLRKDGVEPMVSERTGLRIDPYFSGTKIRWILDNVSGARAKAEAGKLRFGTVDTWLVWQLTRGKLHITDATNASRTLLCNLRTGQWDKEMLSLLKIPESMLPEIRSSSEPYGQVDPSLFPTQAPIAGIAGDQHAALFGQACFSPGMAKNTYGTGCFLLMNTGAEPIASKNNLVTTIAWKLGNKIEYALEGSVFVGGAAIQWLRDELKLVRDVKELDELAASVPDANGLYLVPAFAGLGAPHWDPYARGAALGMTRGTNRAHFCRAALEAIAFQSADLISAMEKDSGLTLKALRVDGGASRSNPLLQFQADLLGTEVIRPKNVETTALGAAYLAGLAVGYWKSREEIAKQGAVDATFSRQRPEADMAKLKAGWAKAVERAKHWETPS